MINGLLGRTLKGVAQEVPISDVFGSWKSWPWRPESEKWIDPEEDIQKLENGRPWPVVCHLDMSKLRQYHETQTDRRSEQLGNFLDVVAKGAENVSDGVAAVAFRGHQKTVAGGSIGRVCFPWLSPPHLTREARAAAAPAGSCEFDMPNAVVFFAREIADELGLTLSAFQLYATYKDMWRQAVMQWLGMSMHDAKKTLLRAVFGFASVSMVGGKARSCPLLDGLASDGKVLKEAIALAHPDLVAGLRAAGKSRPETSAMAYMLFDRENTRIQEFAGLLPKYGFKMVTPVYDAIVAAPTSEGDIDVVKAEQDILDDFQVRSGMRTQVSIVHTPGKVGCVAHIVQKLLSENCGMRTESILTLPGSGMCIPVAVMNLFPSVEEDVKESFQGASGPFSYREVLERCGAVTIDPVQLEDGFPVGTDGCCLARDSQAGSLSQCGHCYGVHVGPSGLVVFSSHESEGIQVNAAKFLQEIRCLQGLKLFKVDVAPAGAAKRRRKRVVPTAVAELELIAGMDLAEDMMSVIRSSMEREVRAEEQRAGLICC